MLDIEEVWIKGAKEPDGAKGAKGFPTDVWGDFYEAFVILPISINRME